MKLALIMIQYQSFTKLLQNQLEVFELFLNKKLIQLGNEDTPYDWETPEDVAKAKRIASGESVVRFHHFNFFFQKNLIEKPQKQIIPFRATDAKGRPYSHTDVLLTIGTSFAIICSQAIEVKESFLTLFIKCINFFLKKKIES